MQVGVRLKSSTPLRSRPHTAYVATRAQGAGRGPTAIRPAPQCRASQPVLTPPRATRGSRKGPQPRGCPSQPSPALHWSTFSSRPGRAAAPSLAVSRSAPATPRRVGLRPAGPPAIAAHRPRTCAPLSQPHASQAVPRRAGRAASPRPRERRAGAAALAARSWAAHSPRRGLTSGQQPPGRHAQAKLPLLQQPAARTRTAAAPRVRRPGRLPGRRLALRLPGRTSRTARSGRPPGAAVEPRSPKAGPSAAPPASKRAGWGQWAASAGGCGRAGGARLPHDAHAHTARSTG
jgi:hypothetical protein